MSSPHTPQQNLLLAALPEAEYARLRSDLELIPMPLGWALYESGGQLSYMYFPTTSIVSLLYVMENGASAEIAITGNEGCRWLLLSLDRLQGNELLMTQELIANMLGVRREGVTEAAGKSQADGLIQYSRGHIKVLDRAKLEMRVCECYAVVKKEFDRLLAYKIHAPPNTTP